MKNRTTIEDILRGPEFMDFKVISGRRGLKSEVKSITVMDAPDPFPWSKGGEIVLSSGYIFKQSGDMKKILLQMKESKNVALFIKTKRYIGEIPEDLKKFSDEIDFPIVDVPIEKAWIDIIYPTLSVIIKNTSTRLARSEEIHRIFTDLVLADSSTETILSVLSDILGEKLLYYNLRSQKYIYPSGQKDIVRKYMEVSIFDLLQKNQNYRIGVKDVTIGYIVFSRLKEDDVFTDEYYVLRHVNTALFLNYQKETALLQIENRHRNDFVQDIIMNNIKYQEEVEKRAFSFGWKFLNPMRVMVVDIDDFKLEYKMVSTEEASNLEILREKIFNNVIEIVRKYFRESYYSTFSDSIAFILSFPENSTISFDALTERCAMEVGESSQFKYRHTVTQGIGTVTDSVMELHRSYTEAIKSVKTGLVINRKSSINFYDRLGVFRILFNVENENEILEFLRMELGKLTESDEKYNTQYIETLEVLDNHNWNLKRSCEYMFIHYNTMKYRVRKIEELLGKDLNSNEVRSNLNLALKIRKIVSDRIVKN